MRPGREAGFRPDGGCGFPIDPAKEAREAEVFWRPEIAPAVVVQLMPAATGAAASLQLVGLATAARAADDGVHLRLPGGLQIQLMAGAEAAVALAAILPLDDDFAARVAAADALYRLLTSGTHPSDTLSPQRRRRLKRMLRALDGQQSGANYRDIAQHVLGETIADSAAWRTSAVRDVAIRLCRGAIRLARSGYLALLRKRG